VLCVVLLLANIILFVLGNWFGPSATGQLREELNPDKIRLLQSNESAPANANQSSR
jgi:hypothetical protein